MIRTIGNQELIINSLFLPKLLQISFPEKKKQTEYKFFHTNLYYLTKYPNGKMVFKPSQQFLKHCKVVSESLVVSGAKYGLTMWLNLKCKNFKNLNVETLNV